MKLALSKKNLWERTPASLKAVIGRAAGLAPLPYLLGRGFREWYALLEDAQWWSADRIQAYQLSQLRRIVTLAFEKSEFYRDHFGRVGFEPGDLKEPSDLAGLPTIDKETVRANLDQMTTVDVRSQSIDYVSTSGTGGTPLGFYLDASRSGIEFAHLTQSWRRVGYRPGMTTAVLRGQAVQPDRTGLYHSYDPLLRFHYYSSFQLNADQMRRYIAHLHRIQPRFLHFYPSSLYVLARFAASEELTLPASIEAALLGSEPVYRQQREFVGQHFPFKLYSWYGHSEKCVLAAECEHSPLYHVWPTYGYCEIVNIEGRPAEQGESGEIVGTSFMNSVTPFIRYRTDDYATLAGDGCSACGRKHTLLADLHGHRTQEYLVTRGKRAIIAWTAVNMHDDTFDGIMKFQFVQREPGAAELRIVPNAGPAAYCVDRIRRHLKQKLNGEIDVSIVVCDDIIPSKSGKKPIVLQLVPDADQIVALADADAELSSSQPAAVGEH